MLYLFPKFFSPTEYGAQRLLIELGALVSSFAILGVGQSAFRFHPYFFNKDEKKFNGFFFLLFALPVVGLLTVSAILHFNEAWFISFIKADSKYAKMIFPMLKWLVFAMALQTLMDSISSIFSRLASQNFFKEICVRLSILGIGFLYYKGIIDFSTSCWLIVIAYGVFSGLSFIWIVVNEKISFRPDFGYIKDRPELKVDIIKYSTWLFLSSLTVLFINKVDFVMISTQKTFADTAIYSVAFYIATLVDIPKRTVTQVVFPFISRHLKSKEYPQLSTLVKQASLNQLVLALLVFGLIWINIDSIFKIIPNGNYYNTGKMVVLIIGIAKIWESMISVMGVVVSNSNFYVLGFINSIISIIVAVGANLLLIPIFGINGAALATFFTIVISTITSMLIVWFKLRIHPWVKNHLKAIILLIVVFGFTLLPSLFENHLIDIGVKSFMLLFTYSSMVYFLNISPEVTQTINKHLPEFLKSKNS